MKRINEHCAAMVDVMIPNSHIHAIACGKRRRGHGFWHAHGPKLRWWGRWTRPVYVGDFDLASSVKSETDGGTDG